MFRILIALMITAMPVWAEQATQWTPAEMVKGRSIGPVAPSPDGAHVVWIESKAVMTDELSVYQGVLYRAQSNGQNRQRLTFGPTSVANPRWSPDGTWIAFTRTGMDRKSQLAVMRASGGEARTLTSVKTGVSDFRWSPDAQEIAYLMVDEPTEEEEKRQKAKDDPVTLDEDLKYQHLFRVALPTDDEEAEPRRITTGEFHVSNPYAAGFNWSPDGKHIVFSHTPTPKLNDWPAADLSIVDLDSGAVSVLRATAASESAPVYSPDGKKIAFVTTADPASWMRESYIALINPDGSGFTPLARTPDESPNILGWLNNRELLVWEGHGTEYAYYKVPAKGGAVKRFDDGGAMPSPGRLSASKTMLGFAVMDWDRAPEAFVSPVKRYRPKQVSEANLTNHPLGKTEVIHWSSTDDFEIEALLTYPVGYQPGTRVPLLLVIHGGPAGYFTRSFIAHPRGLYPTAAFAAEGYAVLRANPRGSGGRGADFRRANKNDWGGGDYEDLMAGVDHVVNMGVADADRLGVMGWSYGGFMTSWVITHTNRFKVASIGAPVTDLRAFNGTADITGFLPDYFEGEFWERAAVYREHSPLTHIANAATPSLIQHGQADPRVPLSQGLALYRALKRRGVETKMVTYPRAPHGPAEPRQVLHVMQENLAWFKQRLPVD
jgi:dipeptidyl aminopeptidase/acylaminoacyl peptidase